MNAGTGSKPVGRAAGKGRGGHPFLAFMRHTFLNRFFVMMVLPAIGLLLIWVRGVEPNRILPRQEAVSTAELSAPAMRRTLRILHLSDPRLGTGKSVLRLQKAVEEGLRLHPDLAVLTGNLGIPGDTKDRATVESTLAYLRSVVPTFACLGNEDYMGNDKPDGRIMTLLLSSGIHVLRNEARQLIVNGIHVTMAGLSDMGHNPQPQLCLTQQDPKSLKENLVLLLSHNPDSLTLVSDYDWHIMFSGHTLGGQFRVPLTSWCPFADGKLTEFSAKGLYKLQDGRRLSVTSGIGNTHELRLNCFPEVVLLEIATPAP